MAEFSAQYYLDMTADEFKAEAERLAVDLYGKDRDQQINAVYNAELRREQAIADEQAAKDRIAQAEADKLALSESRPRREQAALEQAAKDRVSVAGETPRPLGLDAKDKPDYESMTVADLKATAEARGIPLDDNIKKAEIVRRLQDADAGAG